MATVPGSGRGIKWIRDHLNYQGDDCLIWPMSSKSGYGLFGWNGKTYGAHRLMCELVHGPKPTPKHQAAHECGNNLCVNPKHLSWKTPTENQLDRRRHGTTSTGPHGKLTYKKVREIRALRGIKTYNELAAEYGVHPSNITHIMRGDHWSETRKRARPAPRITSGLGTHE